MGSRLLLPDQQPHQDTPLQERVPSSSKAFATDAETVLRAQPPWYDKMWPAPERLHSATHAFCEPGQADSPLGGIDVSSLVANGDSLVKSTYGNNVRESELHLFSIISQL